MKYYIYFFVRVFLSVLFIYKETHAIYIKISLSFVSTLVIATAVKTISGNIYLSKRYIFSFKDYEV